MNQIKEKQIKELKKIYNFYNNSEKLANLLVKHLTVLEIDEFIKKYKINEKN